MPAQAKMKGSYDYLFKVVIVGTSETGKTSIVNRYCDGYFTNSFITTICVDFKIKTIEIKGKKLKILHFDSAGQERFRSLTTNYYRNAHGVLLVYDVHDLFTFEKLENWIKQVNENLDEAKVVKYIVGNKIDLTNKIDVITLNSLLSKHSYKHFLVSAKENLNIDKMFINLYTDILNEYQASTLLDRDKLSSLKIENKSSSKSSCCK